MGSWKTMCGKPLETSAVQIRNLHDRPFDWSRLSSSQKSLRDTSHHPAACVNCCECILNHLCMAYLLMVNMGKCMWLHYTIHTFGWSESGYCLSHQFQHPKITEAPNEITNGTTKIHHSQAIRPGWDGDRKHIMIICNDIACLCSSRQCDIYAALVQRSPWLILLIASPIRKRVEKALDHSSPSLTIN